MKNAMESKIVASFLALLAFAASGQTINQSGSSGTTYTDALGDEQGSGNLLRDISFVTVANDANNLNFTLAINSSGNLATGGAFNYIIGITSGNPSAGGDTSANATTHGNAYGRSISFSSSFGGMQDFIGIFGAGGSGTTGSPYTSYGFNDYAWNTNGVSQTWSKIENVASGEPLSDQPSTSIPNEITITVPLADFVNGFALTPGTTFDFDVMSTGNSGNQTAYDSLADQSPTQSGTFNSTSQDNETILDQYTITEAPEPETMALAGVSGLALMFLRRRR